MFKPMTGNGVVYKVVALMHAILSKADKHLRSEELTDITGHVML
jgi:hypothetical protein